MRVLKSRRGVSPVIATVILVATAITIAVAVAYWMGGITSQYTRFEKVEVVSAYCELTTAALWGDKDGDGNPQESDDDAYPCWVISLSLRNTGTTEATIIGAFINGKAIEDFGKVNTTYYYVQAYEDSIAAANLLDFENDDKLTIEPGSSKEFVLVILDVSSLSGISSPPYSYTSGTTIEVSLHSGAGNSYMKMVTLT